MTEQMRNELLDQFKGYGKLEYQEEDEVLQAFVDAAAESLEKAGIPNSSDSPLYRLAVTRLALHYYECREEVGTGQPIPMGLNWMVEHLRLG